MTSTHLTHSPLYGQRPVERLSPSALTRPRKAPARSIHSSTEEQYCGFSQMVTHPSTNEANIVNI